MAQSSLGPAPIYKLETFGGLTLVGGAPRSLSHQRLRLALLALLAASGERGMSRDKILGYLWPESESGAARHSLEQLLHALRRRLGDSVFAGVNPLALNSEVVRSDVVDFAQALLEEDFASAVGLYRGPFLNGFYLDNASEFERWVETERRRLAGRYIDALLSLAERANAAGDHAASMEWRKRIAETDPLSSRHALQYMQALVMAGDHGAALVHARVHEQLVRQELETEPDPSIVAYAASLREAAAERSSISAPREVEATASIRETFDHANEKEPIGEATSASHQKLRRSWTRRVAVGAIGATLAVIALASWAAVRGTSGPPRDQRLLVIVPFRISSADSAAGYLSEGIVDLLSPLLTGEGGLRAVDARTAISTWKWVAAGHDGTADDARRVARELGAGQALLGSVVVTPTELTLSANVLDSDRGERQPPVRVSGPRDSLQVVVDAFVRELLGRSSGMREQTLASLTTVSTAALRAYIDGSAAYRQAHDADAVNYFARALEIDSTFALAGLDLAVASLKLLRHPVCIDRICRYATVTQMSTATPALDETRFDAGIRLAWQARDKLGPRDRPLLVALRGRRYPKPSTGREMVEDLQQAARVAPDRVEIQYLLGLLMLFQGSALEYADALSRAEVLLANTLRLDSAYLSPLARLVDVAGYEHNAAKLRRYGKLYLAHDSVGATADFVRWRVAAGTGDAAALRAIRARFDSLDVTTLKQIMSASQSSAVALADADRASALIIVRAADQHERESALYEAHMLALNRGRPRKADSLLRERLKATSSEPNFWASSTLAAIFGEGVRETAQEVVQARSAWVAAHPVVAVPRAKSAAGDYASPRALLQQAMWDYDRGDTASAWASVRWLDAHNTAWLGDVVRMLLTTDNRSADAPVLRARVDSLANVGCCGDAPVYTELALARAFENAGDDRNALRVLRHGFGPFFLASFLRRQGEVAYRLKDYAGARRALEHYLVLRSDPEPSLRAERDSIQRVVDALPRE